MSQNPFNAPYRTTHRKAAKEFQIREKYEAELAALNVDSSSLVLGFTSNTAQGRFTSQPR